ncbi:hypothetical protein AY599_25100 [Leptolyngbya valderiana BDU 20041]|nr:hypothetical protein AY599_25100 [Leptolyngbya valderiana BDU 20041]
MARSGWRLVRRFAWPWMRRHRLLSAWLALVVLASGLPCLFAFGHFSGATHVQWSVAGGGIGRVDVGPNPMLGPSRTQLLWYPDASGLLDFDFQWTINGHPVQHPPFLLSVPVWAPLLVPTLLFMAPAIIADCTRHRRATRARRAGRTPCPACGYDATGLAQCPECGAGVGA